MVPEYGASGRFFGSPQHARSRPIGFFLLGCTLHPRRAHGLVFVTAPVSWQPTSQVNVREHRAGTCVARLQLAAQEQGELARIQSLCSVSRWCFLEQAISCPRRRLVDGPTSIWERQEVRTLDGVNNAQRGASFLCSLTGADQRRPLGCLTNLSSLKSKLVIGWPSLYQIDRDLVYSGPLPPSCQCSPPHPPLRGLDSREEFHSCSSSALGESFWRLCVDPWCTAEYTSLRHRGNYNSVFWYLRFCSLSWLLFFLRASFLVGIVVTFPCIVVRALVRPIAVLFCPH